MDGGAKVGEADVEPAIGVGVEEDVLRLDVPVSDVV